MTPAPLPRRKPGLTLVFLGVVALGLAVAWFVRGLDSGTALAVGARAPEFQVELIDGGTFDLSRHLDAEQPRAVVINLWASWCIPCRKEMPELSAFADAHPDVTVIGVAVQDSESASRAFAAEIGATYPLALGDDTFEDAYPTPGLPATFVIDGSGRIEVIHHGIVDRADLEEFTRDL
ncbi:MAG TPA: TlpA disulfide reductase family protein [Acidimicrobiia bacterium]